MSGKPKGEKQIKTVSTAGGLPVVDVEDRGVFINPLTDFGFKRIFGEEANKDLLISFLNAVLELKDGISDLTYTNPERKGRISTDKSVFFDLHCTTKDGDRFIIEMQRLSQKYYKDRSLYYVSFPIQEQGLRQKKWNYKLHPVYSVNIVNFLLDDRVRKENQYIYYIQLIDRDTHKLFYDKLLFVFLELPSFNKTVDELTTNVERWMYVLKHLSELKDRPAALSDKIFKKFFEQAKIANMTPEEKKEYDQSLKNYRDMYTIVNEYKSEIATLRKAHSQEISTMSKAYSQEISTMSKAYNQALTTKDQALATMSKAHSREIVTMKKALQKSHDENEKLRRKFGINNQTIETDN